jgi:hypothetical protein
MIPTEPDLLMTTTDFNHTMFSLDQVVQRLKGKTLNQDHQQLLLAAIQKLQVMVSRAGL